MDVAFLLVLLKAAAAGAAGEIGKQLLAEVRKRLSRHDDASKILENYQQKPDVWAAPLREVLEELQISKDPGIAALAEQVAQRAKISQSAIGHTVVQAVGDIGTVVGGDVHIHTAPALQADGFSSLGVQVPTDPTHDSIYEELAGYLGNQMGSEPGVGVVVDFGQSAGVFESREKDHLRAVARKIMGIRGGDERQSDKFAEIDAMQANDDRTRIQVQFHAQGVGSIREFLSGRPMLVEWVLAESYRVTRCLYSESIRSIYGGSSHGRVTVGVTWPAEGISLGGHLVQATPPSAPTGWRGAKHSWPADFKTDPWPKIQEFAVLALSQAGYKYHESGIRGMDVKMLLVGILIS